MRPAQASVLSGICLSIFTMLMPSQVWADGFRNPFQSASAMAQGNAFRAQVDDPSAIFYNPAGMTQLQGIQTSGGVQFINPNIDFTNFMGESTSLDIPAEIGLPPPGQFYITANMKDLGVDLLGDTTFGFAFLNLFGFAAKYPANGPLNTAVIRAQAPVIDLKPTVAYKISDILSLGLGADIFTFASFLGEGHVERQFIGVGNIPGTEAGDEIELNGKGTTAGLNASFLFTPLRNQSGKPLFNLGFIWRSQAVLPLNGSLLANGEKVADASTSIRFPESYEWGLAGWLVRNDSREWKMEVDIDWVRWSSIRNFDTILDDVVVLPNPQNWNDTVTVGVGTEYKWLRPGSFKDWEMAFRIGYQHAESAVPNEDFDPAIADSNTNLFSIGAGFFCHAGGLMFGFIPCGDHDPGFPWRTSMAIDLVYQAIFSEPRTVTGNPNPAVNGNYTFFTQGGGFNFRVNF